MATKKRSKAASKEALKEALPKLKTRIHVHDVPKCVRKAGTHHASCTGKGIELTCNQVKIGPVKKAVCVHVVL